MVEAGFGMCIGVHNWVGWGGIGVIDVGREVDRCGCGLMEGDVDEVLFGMMLRGVVLVATEICVV